MHNIRRTLLFAWWLSIATVIFFSLKPHVELPNFSGVDKVYHLAAYMELALLATCIFPPKRMPRIALGLALLGVAIEFIQPFTGRTCEEADMFANALGVGIGWGMGRLLEKLMKRLLPSDAHNG